MLEIDLDAIGWQQPADFYNTLLGNLGAPSWHGHNLNALDDSVFGGDINEVEPPFRIVVHHAGNIDEELKTFLREVQTLFDEGRKATKREAYIDLA